MKTNIKKFLLKIILAASLPLICFAEGNDQGSGGHGYWHDGKLYSLDLFLSGVEKQPQYNTRVKINPEILERVRNKFAMYEGQDKFPITKIAQKLSEIEQRHSLFAKALLLSIEMFKWDLVDDEISKISDYGYVLKNVNKNSVQIAVRVLQSIKISRALKNKLDDDNFTGVILHEGAYAITQPVLLGALDTHKPMDYQYKKQDSMAVQQLIGYVFSKSFMTDESDMLNRLIGQIASPLMYVNSDRAYAIHRSPLNNIDVIPKRWLMLFDANNSNTLYGHESMAPNINHKKSYTKDYVAKFCKLSIEKNYTIYIYTDNSMWFSLTDSSYLTLVNGHEIYKSYIKIDVDYSLITTPALRYTTNAESCTKDLTEYFQEIMRYQKD